MRFARLVIVLALIGMGCTQTASPQQSTEAVAALSSQERAWTEAFKNRDRDVLNALLADEFVFTDDEGNVYDKAQYITAAMDVIRVDSYSVDDTKIKSSGDVGMVIGRWTGKMSIDGKDASGVFRFTDTFVKRNGQWQVVASQDTRLPTGQSAEALVANWVNSINSGSGLAAIDQYIAADYVWHLPGGNVRGRDGVKKVFADMFQKCPHLRTTAEHVLADGKWVIVRWTETCSPGGPSTSDITIDRFGNGQFLEGWEIDSDKPWAK